MTPVLRHPLLPLALGLGAVAVWLTARANRRRPAGLPAAEAAFAARARAIRRVPTAEPDLFAFEVSGRLAKRDVQAMADLLEAAFDDLGEVDILLLLQGLEGIDPGAVFDGPSFVAQARSNRHVRRYAVVAPPAPAGALIESFGPLTPVETRTFDAGEEAEAWAWIRASAPQPAA